MIKTRLKVEEFKEFSFGKFREKLPLSNLLENQFKYFNRYMSIVDNDHMFKVDIDADYQTRDIFEISLHKTLKELFPFTSVKGNVHLEYAGFSLGRPIYTEEECRDKKLTYSRPLRLKFRLTFLDKDDVSGEMKPYQSKEDEIFLMNFPMITQRGTFIINGAERIVVSQLHRSPGVTFTEQEGILDINGQKLFTTTIIPYYGSWLEFTMDTLRVLYVLLDRKKKAPGTILLRAFGMSTADILRKFYATKKVNAKTFKRKVGVPMIVVDDVITSKGDVILNAGDDLNDFEISFPEDVKKIEIVDPDKITQTTIIDTLKKDVTKNTDEARKVIYNKLRPGYSYSKQMADNYFEALYFNAEKYSFSYVGRYQINKRLKQQEQVSEDILTLTENDVINTINELLDIRESLDITDDIDNLANRRVRMVHEQLDVVIRSSMLKQKRNVVEKLGSNDIEGNSVLDIFHTRHIEASINDFFARSQLSQFMDEINPLATMTHLRRLSALGPGGLNRKRAGFKVRDIHPTHFGRICPIETPEGPNIGLITHLSTYARFNNKGFIETPVAKVVNRRITDEIVYQTADESESSIIASADVTLNDKQVIQDKYVYCHLKYDVGYRKAEEVEFIDVSPMQMVSLSSSLIPFLEHDDANRALMGSNMQRQSVPLLYPEPPIVNSGMEIQVAKDSHSALIAAHDGVIEYVDAERIVLKKSDISDGISHIEFRIQKFRRSNQDTTKNQVPIVKVGQAVKVGDFLTDGMSISHGTLALGKNLKVAFMPWQGYNYEDAIIVSDRLVKEDVLTSVHISESKVDAIITKLGREEITGDIPNIDLRKIAHLDERGIIRIGTKIKPGDILVGKITPQGETELSGEDRLLSIIFGKKASNVKNTSLYADEKTYGTVIGVRVFSRKKIEEDDITKKETEWKLSRLERAVNLELHKMEEDYKETVYEKVKGKEISKTIKNLNGGNIEKGTKINKKVYAKLLNNKISLFDIFLEDFVLTQDLSILKEKFEFAKERSLDSYDKERSSIIKSDDLPSGVIKSVVVYIAQIRKIDIGDKLAGRHGNKGVISKVAPAEDMPFMADGTPVDIILNPLGVPSRMNIGQIYETLLGLVGEQLGVKFTTPVFDGATEKDISEYLKKIGDDGLGKMFLKDGVSGEFFDQPVTVGVMYILKLNHLGKDKLHARATGPYSLVTQQPLGGKAQKGGQRLGEMEVWALEAYGAAYTLQEMFTFKSDDVIGRNKVHEAIIKDKFPMTPNVPEAFNVLVKEMQAMGFDVIREIDPKTKKIANIQLRLAPNEKMLEWATRKNSYVGEVKKADTINYKSFKPEKEGLFCEKIFGPTRDWKCSCGKYKGRKYAGQVCERCGVEITEKNVRRRYMGIIKLVAPIANILYFQGSLASLLATILDLKTKQIENIIYYESYVVTEVMDEKLTKIRQWDVINEIEYRNLMRECGWDSFKAVSGAEAIYLKLKSLDIENKIKELQVSVGKFRDSKKIKGNDLKQLKSLLLLEKIKKSGNLPEWVIWHSVPVLPPDLRPLVPLEGSKFASADLNDLYRKVLNRNNRLKKFLEDDVPEIILKNEKRMLQESVDVLIDNGRRGNAIVGSNGSPLKSLAELLRSKQGRFRQNLLGKRVDFSGRAVIVINPKLKLSECGLPVKIGRELFKTFIEREKNKRSKQLVAAEGVVAKDIDPVEIEKMLENEYDKNLILLNRAPTLHRMSIQAFKPRLIQGSAIQLHPLVCSAFNADFDGDQMGVHLPLTPIAQLESRMLIWSINNILSPSNGEPIVVPSQDMILGLYYLTAEKKFSGVAIRKFYSIEDLFYQYEYDMINNDKVSKRMSLHTPVELFYKGKWHSTTVGRAVFNYGLHEELPYFNKTINKKNIREFINNAWDILERDDVIQFLDYLKETGFFYSTRGGITFGLWDIIIPDQKNAILAKAQDGVNALNDSFARHEITDVERSKNIINIWTSVDERLKEMMIKKMEKGNPKDKKTHFNPIFIMLDSGARGSQTQIKQLASLRGLMENPSGEIIEIPIKSNFMEGLNVLEFFISAHGARKGLADTALKTSESGYLTRRLVDVSHDIIVKEHDCGTTLGIEVMPLSRPPFVKEQLAHRIYGRVAFEDVINSKTGEKIVGQNEIISKEAAFKIENAGIESIRVRSPLTCQTERGICQLCYGMDLSKKKIVEMGSPVGIIAAQSIGEPGTQLTMRTFHIGGVTSRKSEEEIIHAELLLLEKGESYKQFEIEKKLLDADFKNVKKVEKTKQYTIDRFNLIINSPNYPGKKFTITFSEQGTIVDIKDNKGKKYDEISIIQGKMKYRLKYNKEKNSEGKHLNLSRDGELVILSDIKEEVRIVKDEHGTNIIFKTAAEDIKNPKTKEVICPEGHIIDGNRTSKILMSDLDNVKLYRELERYAVPFGSELLIKNGMMLKKKTPIAVKPMYFEPIIAEESGKVEYHNIDFSPDTKTKSDKIVIQPAMVTSSRLQPRIIINGKEHQIEVSRIVKGVGKGEKEIHTTHITVAKGNEVKRGDFLGKVVIKKSEKTDITGGLMKVEELFEARHRKSAENAILSEITGTVEIYQDKTKKIRGAYPVYIKITEPTGGEKKYKINFNQQIIVKDGDRVEQGEPLTTGVINLFDLLRIKGADFVRRYIVDEVKSIYKLQGITIHDKHIEIIVNKMLSKVSITKIGDSKFLPEQIVDKTLFQREMVRLEKSGGRKPESEQTLLGISKVAIQTDSWLSAASFQETIKVLSLAALEGRVDHIRGLKENIIIGNLIPAGTGFRSEVMDSPTNRNLEEMRHLLSHFAWKDSKEENKY